jgi:hypothetical protein
LRTEFGPDIGITIVTPGLIDSEMTTMENRIKVYFEGQDLATNQLCGGKT